MARPKKTIPEFSPKLVWHMAREAVLFAVLYQTNRKLAMKRPGAERLLNWMVNHFAEPTAAYLEKTRQRDYLNLVEDIKKLMIRKQKGELPRKAEREALMRIISDKKHERILVSEFHGYTGEKLEAARRELMKRFPPIPRIDKIKRLGSVKRLAMEYVGELMPKGNAAKKRRKGKQGISESGMYYWRKGQKEARKEAAMLLKAESDLIPLALRNLFFTDLELIPQVAITVMKARQDKFPTGALIPTRTHLGNLLDLAGDPDIETLIEEISQGVHGEPLSLGALAAEERLGN